MNAKRRRHLVKRIALRDGWTCWLCGHLIDPQLHAPHAESVTLDHVVPQVRGGSHA